jgi:transposase-like protein
MSKIPQGEWNAIAARYSQGEPISSIARHYGCTAPAIHYILKRNKERTAETDRRPALAQTPTTAEVAWAARLGGEQNGRSRSSVIVGNLAMGQVKALPLKQYREEKSESAFAPPVKPVRTDLGPVGALQQQRGRPGSQGRASALTAELDADLRAHAEAAIQTFRSGFDAALAENSPVMRERLRQAASNLMRAAARTTIVLDRLDAGGKRAQKEMTDWPQPSSAQEDARSATPA